MAATDSLIADVTDGVSAETDYDSRGYNQRIMREGWRERGEN